MDFQIVAELLSESGPSQPEVEVLDPIVEKQAMHNLSCLIVGFSAV